MHTEELEKKEEIQEENKTKNSLLQLRDTFDTIPLDIHKQNLQKNTSLAKNKKKRIYKIQV